jgi:Tfp pilus assembly PilM family ATPase
MFSESHAGLTFNNVKIQVTEFIANEGFFSVSKIDENYFDEEIDFKLDKETKIISLLTSAFDELRLKNPINSNSLSISLPQNLFVTAKLPIEHSLLYTDLIEEFRWNLSILYPHLSFDNSIIQHFEVIGNNFNTHDLALVFALDRKYLKIMHDFSEKINIKLRFVDHCHLASSNLLRLTSKESSSNQISFYISAQILSMLITDNGKPIHYEDIPIKSINEVISIIRYKINEVSQKQIKFNEICLFGDSSSQVISSLLSKSTGINVKLVNSFSSLKVASDIMSTKFYTSMNHFFSASVGAAVRV